MASVKKTDNLLIQDNSDLKLITSGPKEVYDSKMINQSLIHKNKKTLKEQSNAFSSSNTENEYLHLLEQKDEKSRTTSDRLEIKTLPVCDRDKQIPPNWTVHLHKVL